MKDKLNNLILHLKKDKITNISTIGFIENNPISEIIEINNSYLIKGTSDVEWTYVVCNNESDLRALLEKSGSNTYFASVEDWMIPIITEKRKAEWILSTMRYYLPEDVEVPENKLEVIPLTTDHIGFIISQSNYKQFLTPAYVEERISKSISAAIIKKDKLVAWGLTHDDGALGSLHVLDEYRKKGYGKEILISLIHQNRKLDKMSFAQIEERNINAARLVESLGFKKRRRVSWVKLS
ncbi:MAG: GNAT family N-acetyltransferase [Ignavibacteriales bacterium]|nr:GNAT family N-acetyltransferase [Ignavibacteriales bacterium]